MAMQLNDVKLALRSIQCGFVWHDTPQGWKYWAGVVDALRKLEALAYAEAVRNDTLSDDDATPRGPFAQSPYEG